VRVPLPALLLLLLLSALLLLLLQRLLLLLLCHFSFAGVQVGSDLPIAEMATALRWYSVT
jgi:hypothetical protein